MPIIHQFSKYLFQILLFHSSGWYKSSQFVNHGCLIWMHIHQFYFISDDDAITLFAVQVSPVRSLEMSPVQHKFCPVSPQHMFSVQHGTPVAQKLFTCKLFPSIYLVHLVILSAFLITLLVASVWNVCTWRNAQSDCT